MGSILSKLFRKNDNISNVKPKLYREEIITFSSLDKSLDLAGTLTFPNNNANVAAADNDTATSTTNNGDTTAADKPPLQQIPAAIILHGSGPIDRDGNAIGTLPLGIGSMKLNTQNQLAQHLSSSSTSKKLAVLRYDKRGIGKSGNGNVALYHQAGLQDLVDDAVAAYQYLVEHPRIDSNNIFLIGHSEGAIILPLVARNIINHTVNSGAENTNNKLPPPKGLIFLAGYGESLFEAMNNQRERVLKEVDESKGITGWILRKVLTRAKLEKQYNDLMKKIFEESKNQNKDVISTKLGLIQINAKWFRQHRAWDAHEELITSTAGLHCLAMTGSKDVQVKCEYCDPATSHKLVSPKVASLETHVVPNVTHVLRAMPDNDEAKLLDIQKVYGKQSQQLLDSNLLSILDNWIQRIILE